MASLSSLPVNPDLVAERAKATFDPRRINELLCGGKAGVQRRERLLNLIQNHPNDFQDVGSKVERYTLGRTQLFDRGLKLIRILYDLKEQHKMSDSDFEELFYVLSEDLPIQLQVAVFIPCLKALASDAQLAEWLPKAQRYEMIGCYSQTELSHGSNVMGLKTVARYDPNTDEFVVNTPSPDATKWWIGQLGKLANHTVLFAQLEMPNGDGTYQALGPHPFLVQLRSWEDHKPLPGITIGDIGPKFGFQATDNGFLSFKDVRVPRANLLARYTKIDPVTKKYVPPTNAKLLYGSMLAVRSHLVKQATLPLQAASTISIRYSAVRRQFADPTDPLVRSSAPEKQVLDYMSQKYRLLPQMATAYAMYFTGQWMGDLLQKLYGDFAKGDFSLLPAMHANSSGLKSLMTFLACEGSEICRMACGGHGYSQFSGLPIIYSSFVQVCTAEGENWLLNQQTTRQLLKLLQAAVASPDGAEAAGRPLPKGFHPLDPAMYLLRHKPAVLLSEKCTAQSAEDFYNPAVYLNALEHRATRVLANVALGLQEAASNGSLAAAWDSQLIETHQAARAHCYVVLAQIFVDQLAALKSSTILGDAERQVLQKVATLFAVYTIEKDLGQFTEDNYMSEEQCKLLRQALKNLLNDLRDQAVALVDAFGLPDWSLNSAIGGYNGQPYATLLDWAKNHEPLNKTLVPESFVKHIQPLVQRHRKAKL